METDLSTVDFELYKSVLIKQSKGKEEYDCCTCVGINVQIVESADPWTDSHWGCPICHGTHNIWEYPRKKDITI